MYKVGSGEEGQPGQAKRLDDAFLLMLQFTNKSPKAQLFAPPAQLGPMLRSNDV